MTSYATQLLDDTTCVEAAAWNIDTLGPFEPQPVIAVAISGGPDSMACAFMARDWAMARGGSIVTLTVDHGLRPESRDEAEYVARVMHAQGITHHILTPAFSDVSNNLLESARIRRYDALAAWCRSHAVLHCLVAHHANDQRETTLLQQSRGVTADGGSGMAKVRTYQGVRFLRPLLGATKDALVRHLQDRRISWIEDPSNMHTHFARVRVRKELAENPALTATADALLVARHAARHERERAVSCAAMACATVWPAGYITIDRHRWCQLEDAIASQLIADSLRCVSGESRRARTHEIQRLHTSLRTQPQGKRSLQHCIVEWSSTHIRIAREISRAAPAITLQGKGVAFWDQRFRVEYDMPEGIEATLGPLSRKGVQSLRQQGCEDAAQILPAATPAVWHLDAALLAPHIHPHAVPLPKGMRVQIGFRPAKPLAAPPFW